MSLFIKMKLFSIICYVKLIKDQIIYAFVSLKIDFSLALKYILCCYRLLSEFAF